MKSEAAALEGILDFLLKSKPKKEDKKTGKKIEKKVEKEEEEEEIPDEVAKSKTIMFSMGQLGRKKATKKEVEELAGKVNYIEAMMEQMQDILNGIANLNKEE